MSGAGQAGTTGAWCARERSSEADRHEIDQSDTTQNELMGSNPLRPRPNRSQHLCRLDKQSSHWPFVTCCCYFTAASLLECFYGERPWPIRQTAFREQNACNSGTAKLAWLINYLSLSPDDQSSPPAVLAHTQRFLGLYSVPAALPSLELHYTIPSRTGSCMSLLRSLILRPPKLSMLLLPVYGPF